MLDYLFSLLGTKKDNLAFNGYISVPGQDVTKAKLKLNLSFSNLDVVKIKNVAKAYGVDLNDAPLDDTAYVKANIKEVDLATQKVSADVDVALQNSPAYKVKATVDGVASKLGMAVDLLFKGTPFKLNSDMAFAPSLLHPSRVEVQPSTLVLFGGSGDFEAGYALGGNKNFSLTSKASGLDIAKMYKFATDGKSSVSLSGAVQDFTTDLKGSGVNPKETVSGSLGIVIKNGAVEGINALRESFETALKVPGFSETLIGYLPERYKGLLKDERTVFETFESAVTLGGQKMNINRLLLKHADYELSGTGTVTFAGEIAMKAILRLSKDTSEYAVKKNNKLSLLLDSDNLVAVPISITKSPTGKPAVVPDTEEIMKRVVQGVIAQKSGAINEKVDNMKGKATEATEKATEKVSEKIDQGAQKLSGAISNNKALGRIFGQSSQPGQ